MKIPVIWRSDHEAIRDGLLAQVDVLHELNSELRVTIQTKNNEIEALKAILTSPKCNDYTSKDHQKPESGKSTGPIVNSRSGWRGMARLMSEATIPAPKDSMQALELRVKREGGKTDAV